MLQPSGRNNNIGADRGLYGIYKNYRARAEDKIYKELLMTMTSAHRAIHNRMHWNGIYHRHSVKDDHHSK